MLLDNDKSSDPAENTAIVNDAPQEVAKESPRLFADGLLLRSQPHVSRRETLLAALVCALLVTLFLAPTILRGRYLSPADLLIDYYPWRDVRPDNWPGASNPLMSDSVLQFEPWLYYVALRLHAGELPLWNSENMLGAPFLANMQSAVFYPLNWPYFLWPDGSMLTLRVWLKLFFALLGTYLLARHVARVGPLSSLIAAITFGFGAFMTAWVLYPHTNAALLLPWIWLATALLVERPGKRRVGLLALLVGLSLLAGHPETAYQIAAFTGLFLLFLLWARRPERPGSDAATMASDSRLNGSLVRSSRLRSTAARRSYLASVYPLLLWLLAYSLGVTIALVQILPFLEYLLQSATWSHRTGDTAVGFWLPLSTGWSAFAGGLFGSPVDNSWWYPTTNYNESGNFNGVLPLVLAPFSLLGGSHARRRLSLFLLGGAAVCLMVIYRAPLVWDVVTALPLMKSGDTNRLLLGVQLALALLAALGADNLITALRERDATRRLWLLLGALIASLLAVGVALPWITAHERFGLPREDRPVAIWYDGLTRAAVLILLSGLLIAAFFLLRRYQQRLAPLALLALPLLLGADLYLSRSGLMPNVAPQNYYPDTKMTQFLQQQEQDGVFRVLPWSWMLLPNTNLRYGIADMLGYDAMAPRTYQDLVAAIDAQQGALPGSLAPLISVQSRVINLLNVRYVLALPGQDPNIYDNMIQNGSRDGTAGAITGANKPGQTFTAIRNNLERISVWGSTRGRAAGILRFHLKTSPDAPTDIFSTDVESAALPDDSFWSFPFPMIRDSGGKQYYFYIEAVDTAGRQVATLWYTKGDPYAVGSRTSDGVAVEGDLVFRTSSSIDPDNPWFVRVGEDVSAARIYENTQALPRAWLAHSAQVVSDTATMLGYMRNPEFDRAGTALLYEPLLGTMPLAAAPVVTASDRVDIISYRDESVEIRTSSSAAGLLMLADQAFPGWEATINGQPTPILTADHALRAVYVPAGEHTVRFNYAPLNTAWARC